MAPIRRYLRITKYSVLECRIYVDNPAMAESWLLNSRNPMLPRVIEKVRPLVLPKLKEENERSRGKGGNKKKGVKDVVVDDDFEVSIFLTETTNRHSLLTKQKHFLDPNKKRLQSNSSKLTGETDQEPIDLDLGSELRTEDEEPEVNLQDLPAADGLSSDEDGLFVSDNEEALRRSKRPRTTTIAESDDEISPEEPVSKRLKNTEEILAAEDEPDDKKKMAMSTTYDGFSIYGRILCLIVKRKDKRSKQPAVIGGQAMMEDWITSTQINPQGDDD